MNNQQEKLTEFIEGQKYSRNELLNELEQWIIDQRQYTETFKDKKYKQLPQLFPGFDMEKATAAKEVLVWLKQFVETDNFKLDCI